MKMVRMVLCALGALTLVTTVQAQVPAQTLYGATAAGAQGRLYTLDPATGAVVQDIGPLNDAAGLNYGVTGLAFDPLTGVLYGSSGNAYERPARLLTIDPTTAMVTEIGPFNGPVSTSDPTRSATMADLAFDPTTGALLGVGSIGGPQLYSVNTATGQVTVIGSTGLTSTTGGGIAIGATGQYFGTPTASRFGTYDPTTGAYANIANPAKPAGGGAYAALDFNAGGVLYGVNLGPGTPPPSHLVTIDPVTGVVTDLGASVDSLDAIAFRPGGNGAIPEPGTLALLFGSGILGAVGKLRRRK